MRALILENDCVVIPQLGGFISHYMPATYIASEKLYLPPYRTLVFNTGITVNDGLLIQSYMARHHVSYAAASQLVERDVAALRDELSARGSVTFDELGTLMQQADHLQFSPVEGGCPTPSLYGLDGLSVEPAHPKKQENIYISLNRAHLLQTLSTAAAIILFFLFSIPMSHDKGETDMRASLGFFPSSEQLNLMDAFVKKTLDMTPAEMIVDAEIAPQSSVTRPIVLPAQENEPKNIPVAKAQEGHRYDVIVASLVSESDAQTTIDELSRMGLKGCKYIKCGYRYRVSMFTTGNVNEAQQRLAQLQQKSRFGDAWVLVDEKTHL